MLKEVARGLGLSCFDEGSLPAPTLDLVAEPEFAHAALRKKSLVRHENYLRRMGTLQVHHFQDGKDILPHLDEFFEQHVARWAVTPYASPFNHQIQRDFYQKLTRVAARAGWLRFTRVDWGGDPVAFHFGFCYRDNYLWYKPSFAIELARRSPGEVLLRQLLVAAMDEGASRFDFGLGDEAFKQRFATHTNNVRTWGLYPC
jgi:CelD/BcsL family acetyltransferase involved in cellulose biosynthesis